MQIYSNLICEYMIMGIPLRTNTACEIEMAIIVGSWKSANRSPAWKVTSWVSWVIVWISQTANSKSKPANNPCVGSF